MFFCDYGAGWARVPPCTYLVGAPVPRGQYGEAQGHAGPGQVSGDGVPEQVHGVLAWQVAGTVGDDLTGHCGAVHALQVPKSPDLVESCGRGEEGASFQIADGNVFLVFFLL